MIEYLGPMDTLATWKMVLSDLQTLWTTDTTDFSALPRHEIMTYYSSVVKSVEHTYVFVPKLSAPIFSNVKNLKSPEDLLGLIQEFYGKWLIKNFIVWATHSFIN